MWTENVWRDLIVKMYKLVLWGIQKCVRYLHDNVKNLKEEVDSLKNAIQSLIKTREEGDWLKKSVEDIKEEIKLLTKSNKEIKKNNY